jgi:hypothetical protein
MPKNGPAADAARRFAAGDVVLCNLQSALDPFVIEATIGRPAMFVFASTVGGTPADVHDSPWAAARRALRAPSASAPTTALADLASLRTAAAARGVVVVFFPEATTSNGRGVLRFANASITVSAGRSFSELRVMGITYGNASATNCVIPEGFALFWLRCLGRSAFRGVDVAVTVARPAVVAEAAANATVAGTGPTPAILASPPLQHVLADAVSFERTVDAACRPLAAASVEDKVQFVAQWDATMGASSTAASAPAAAAPAARPVPRR